MLHRLTRHLCIFTARMSPTLNGSFALQRFRHNNEVKLHNEIMFNFYQGLPHMLVGGGNDRSIDDCTTGS